MTTEATQIRLCITHVRTKEKEIDESYPLTSTLGNIYPNARFACGGRVVSGATTLEDLHKLAPTKDIINIIAIPQSQAAAAAAPTPPVAPAAAKAPAVATAPAVAQQPSTIQIIIDHNGTVTELNIEPTHSVNEYCQNGTRIVFNGRFKIYNESRPLTFEDIIIESIGKKYDKTRSYTFKIIDPVGSKAPTMQEQLAERRRKIQNSNKYATFKFNLGNSVSMTDMRTHNLKQLGESLGFSIKNLSVTCTVSVGNNDTIELDSEYCEQINDRLKESMVEHYENGKAMTAFQYHKEAIKLLKEIGGIENPDSFLITVLSDYGKHCFNIIRYFSVFSEIYKKSPQEYIEDNRLNIITLIADFLNAIPSTKYRLATLECFPDEVSVIFKQVNSNGERSNYSSNMFVPNELQENLTNFGDTENEKFDPEFWNKFFSEKFNK